jgi:hypothetical protein
MYLYLSSTTIFFGYNAASTLFHDERKIGSQSSGQQRTKGWMIFVPIVVLSEHGKYGCDISPMANRDVKRLLRKRRGDGE